MTHDDRADLENRTVEHLRGLLSRATKFPVGRIDPDALFDGFGLDSVMALTMTAELESLAGPLPKTLFFELRTVRELARYLVTNHAPRLSGSLGGTATGTSDGPGPGRPVVRRRALGTTRWHTGAPRPPAADPAAAADPATSPATAADLTAEPASGLEPDPAPAADPAPAPTPAPPAPAPAPVPNLRTGQDVRGADIAIIGLAGRYPGARTPEEFWDNLAAGRDCITEIPAERWDHEAFFDPDPQAPGRTCTRWGGFLEGLQEFDPLFFAISPAEAVLMDPQERLFLQCVHETFEDAGYTAAGLVAPGPSGRPPAVGVYVGVMYEEYQLYAAQEQVLGNPVTVSGNTSAVANRVSSFFDLHGPSLSVDTMCSSSLTAIHLACEAISSGSCDLAVAGGVNVSVHPNKYLMLGRGRFASTRGRCESFAAGGDGYVPGEGVGAVLLKPLEHAVRDGDRVHGIIRGVAVNHGGRTNGYSVPSPVAQAQCLLDAWQRAGIDPRTITCLEAHGTGTALGDPIEVAGLTRAMREHTPDTGFCSLGSVKSNIGHCESASGIAALTKVLLQMRHGELVPTLHCAEPNPHIDFDNSPFTLQQTRSPWRRPVLIRDGVEQEFPRIAGISSFGAGGSNAHLVVEESRPAPGPAAPAAPRGPVAIVLSARSTGQVQEQARRLADWLGRHRPSSSDLPSIARTLQIGREPLRERVGFVIDDIDDLRRALRDLGADRPGASVFHGTVGEDVDAAARLAAEADLPGALSRRDLPTLLDLWTRGVGIDWAQLYDDPPPPRLGLPTYPFRRDPYWLDTSRTTAALRGVLVGADQNQDQPLGQPSGAQGQPGPNTGGVAEHALVLTEDWVPAALPSARSTRPRTLVCLCTDPADQQALTRAARDLAPGTTLVFVARGTGRPGRADGSGPADGSWTVDDRDPHACAGVLREIHRRHGVIDGVLNLWTLEDVGGPEQHRTTLNLLRAVANCGLPVRRIVQAGQFSDGRDLAYLESWAGFSRSLPRTLPDVRFSAVLHDAPTGEGSLDPRTWFTLLHDELSVPEEATGHGTDVLYRGGVRHVRRVVPSEVGPGRDLLRRGGTYLITGGTRGLGLVLAEHLARTRSARLVLTGRSPLDEAGRERIARIVALGGRVLHVRADVTDRAAMREVVRRARARFGPLHGVVHAAGAPGRGSFRDTPDRTFRDLMSAKVEGTLVLDEVLADEPLDVVCYFSSTSAVLGDFGGCDYAVANRFQTAYARHRDEQVRRGALRGATVAFDWPLWRGGGMGFDQDDSTELYLSSTGLRLLEPDEGLALFEQLLGQGASQHIVLVGDRERVRRLVGLDPRRAPGTEPRPTAAPTPASAPPPGPAPTPESAPIPESAPTPTSMLAPAPASESRDARSAQQRAVVLAELVALIGEILRVSPEEIHVDESLSRLGFDSIALTRLAAALSRRLGTEVLASVFFSYPTVEKLVAHLVAEHGSVLKPGGAPTSGTDVGPGAETGSGTTSAPGTDATPGTDTGQGGAPTSGTDVTPGAAQTPGRTVAHTSAPDTADPIRDSRQAGVLPEPIAVIGMAGRFPAARTVEEFWQNLLQGRDAHSDVPGDRRQDWEDPHSPLGQVRCGFVPGIAEFDPAFFEISPREAHGMDPRQRLLLQEAWHALEDAGYGEGRLRAGTVGMFVGAEQGDYLHLTAGHGGLTGQHDAIMASRLGYLLDFSGPVLTVNTACSSGLVAAHQACTSLRGGECDTAVVAGVSLVTTSQVFREVERAGMLSPSGICRAFDTRADGMLLAEAVAVVVLKRLSSAQTDGDTVLAVIRGSGLNYDGRTNGITAPSGAAQERLYRSVYERHGLDPADIGHVVAHGTGTRLGDPVEVNGLNAVLPARADGEEPCALTSIKPAVGHTLAASGLVSLIALVQSVRHGVVPATLHCEQESDQIDWRSGPLRVVRHSRPWPAGRRGTRLGAVNSFGMSGTNVHMVVESHPAPAGPGPDVSGQDVSGTAGTPSGRSRPQLLLLSAKTSQALGERVRELGEALQQDGPARCLTDTAYTLSEGRHHFAHRCALVVGDVDDAVALLDAVSRGELPAGVHRGTVSRGQDHAADDVRYATLLERLARQGTGGEEHREFLEELAVLYCRGAAPARTVRPDGGRPRLVALPGYPFDRSRYWITELPTAGRAVPAPEPVAPLSVVASVDTQTTGSTEAHSGLVKIVLSRPDRTLPVPAAHTDGQRKVVLGGLPPAAQAALPAEPSGALSVKTLERELRSGLAEVLCLPVDDVGPEQNFLELGLDSVVGVEWVKSLNSVYGTELAAARLYDHPSVRAFARFLSGQITASAPSGTSHPETSPPETSDRGSSHPGTSDRGSSDRELSDPEPSGYASPEPLPDQAGRPRRSRSRLIEELRQSLADALFLDPGRIGSGSDFVELGMDSIIGVEWVKAINKSYGTTLAATRLYDHPTLRALAAFVETQLPDTAPEPPAVSAVTVAAVAATSPATSASEPKAASEPAPTASDPAATESVRLPAPAVRTSRPAALPPEEQPVVIGMSGRYPRADNLREYWANLREGRDCVQEVPPTRWDVARYYDPRPGVAGRTNCKWMGYLADADCFDPLFFNISPVEAEGLDPQHRLFLQEAYRSFEDAGHDPRSLGRTRCGVYLGISGNEYSFLSPRDSDGTSAATSSSNAIAAARIAYFLNLRGPAIALDTACSSSLVALHLAQQALANHEIDLALVGGVSLYLLPQTYVGMSRAGMLSARGQCRSFDDDADGFVPGEAAGALVLKRRADAEADHDHIYGVLLASGINQDGRTNGITAPSTECQMELVRSVYDRHGIEASSIGYVEMHGTGTKLGDPIEFEALDTVYRERGVPARSCAIGSVKSNIGHTSAAAGIAGVHKVLLGMRHGLLVPSLHFDRPNEHLALDRSAFHVPTVPEPWVPRAGYARRRAAVSSFGFSGTNAHVVLEEYPHA